MGTDRMTRSASSVLIGAIRGSLPFPRLQQIHFSLLVIWLAASTGCEPPPAPQVKRVAPANERSGSDDSLVAQVRQVREGKSDAVELESQPVSDDDLEPLAGLTGLRKLVLKKAGISDAGLRHLAGLTELQT